MEIVTCIIPWSLAVALALASHLMVFNVIQSLSLASYILSYFRMVS